MGQSLLLVPVQKRIHIKDIKKHLTSELVDIEVQPRNLMPQALAVIHSRCLGEDIITCAKYLISLWKTRSMLPEEYGDMGVTEGILQSLCCYRSQCIVFTLKWLCLELSPSDFLPDWVNDITQEHIETFAVVDSQLGFAEWEFIDFWHIVF